MFCCAPFVRSLCRVCKFSGLGEVCVQICARSRQEIQYAHNQVAVFVDLQRLLAIDDYYFAERIFCVHGFCGDKYVLRQGGK